LHIARNLHIQLKDGKQREFIHLFESQILPVLRQQPGFRQELTLLDNNRALVISFWDDRKNLQAYHTSVFPRLVEKLNPVMQSTPSVETFDVANSTMPAMAA
jgi:heme-degrading monooxygenase HmoA